MIKKIKEIAGDVGCYEFDKINSAPKKKSCIPFEAEF